MVEEELTIGAVAERSGLAVSAIRFYEARGLLNPGRFRANRIYSKRDRARLMLILRGKNLGFSLEDIVQYLALYDADPKQLAQTRMLLEKADAHIAALRTKRSDLDRTLKELKKIRAECAAHLAAQRG